MVKSHVCSLGLKWDWNFLNPQNLQSNIIITKPHSQKVTKRADILFAWSCFYFLESISLCIELVNKDFRVKPAVCHGFKVEIVLKFHPVFQESIHTVWVFYKRTLSEFEKILPTHIYFPVFFQFIIITFKKVWR